MSTAMSLYIIFLKPSFGLFRADELSSILADKLSNWDVLASKGTPALHPFWISLAEFAVEWPARLSEPYILDQALVIVEDRAHMRYT